jgi:hypothetical protein
MNSSNNKKIMTLALAGLATGAAVWYLLKTEHGKQTCNQLVDSFKDNWKDKLDMFSGSTRHMVNDLKSRAESAMNVPS